MKVFSGMELRLPSMVILPSEVVAEVRRGKFWRVLAPVSGSLGSFLVTPSEALCAAVEVYAKPSVGEG